VHLAKSLKLGTKLSVFVAAMAIFTGSNLHAQSLLSVEVGNSSSAPSGFDIFNPTYVPNNNAGLPLESTNFGPITLTLNAASIANENNAPAVNGSGDLANWGNGIITRERNPIGTTDYGPMYQGFATAAGGGALGLEIAGLSANTEYDITFYSFDENGSRTSVFTDYTGSEDSLVGSIAYSNLSGAGSGDPTFDSEYSLTAEVTTDSAGRLIFSDTEAGNAPVLDGFQISAVPEPSSVAMAGLGGLSLFMFRRRKYLLQMGQRNELTTLNPKKVLTGLCLLSFLAGNNLPAQTSYYFDVNGASAGSGVVNGGSYGWDGNWGTDSGLASRLLSCRYFVPVLHS